jgi:NitT/TauT family transport system substrate-binding protein
MRKKFMSMIVVLSILAFTATLMVCGSATAAPKKSEYLYFVGSTPHYTPMVIATQKGYFKQYGLNVKIKTFTSGGMAAQSFMAGQGDFACTGDWPATRMWAKAKETIGLHQITGLSELNVMVTRSDITKGSQLKGKRLGYFLGTASEFMATKFLTSYGLTMDDVTLKNIPPTEMVVALDRGDLDAFAVWQPFGWRALKISGKKVHILTTGVGLFTSHMMVSTKRKLVQTDPDACVAEIRGILKALDFMNDNLDESTKIVADFFKIPFDDVKRFILGMDFGVAYSKKMRNDMNEVTGFMIKKGKSKGPIDWQNSFAPQFLKTVNPKYVE